MIFSVGDFGWFEFEMVKKIKRKERIREYSMLIKGHYEVKDVDPKNVLLWDGDKELIVTQRRISKFERKDKPVKK